MKHTDVELHVKNMVCHRCILAVQDILNKLAIPYAKVELGIIYLTRPINETQLQALHNELTAIGFYLLNDRRQQIIEQIKTWVIQYIRDDNPLAKETLSEFLSDKIGADYSFLSKLFSETMGITIERYTILQRIERTKELLIDGELSLSQIADQLHYSSVSHLSTQFKNITGLTPTVFKQLNGKGRISIDQIHS